ncbi:MAG: DUF928 domain-containing protein [Drouetiella hepatica Uher 2000/2452]|jgi:hypothetical protein|uniref:DUF928 domain-containing protein n=1 Tax=Drouetiella hepatica Uher 2000/2452 TaxID=904376 RepID=A0A951QGC8_9CYAN|nr:DUF928 domain-containing protein [Drouetiella hepatica Uher 2000/2452]
MVYKKISLLGIALWLGLNSWTSNWTSGWADEITSGTMSPQMQMSPLQISQLPPPPWTPPPNRTRAGGSLSDAKACTSSTENLLAIVPTENPVVTTLAHPTVLFYVPYGASDVQSGEFSVLVGPNEMTRLYRARFKLPSSPGIVSVKLPETADTALTLGKSYHWYFKLYCTGNTTSKADLQVDGWIQRVEATPERDRQIQAGTPEVWYDALAKLADHISAMPQNAQLRERWRSLLTIAGAADAVQKPIVGEVVTEP